MTTRKESTMRIRALPIALAVMSLGAPPALAAPGGTSPRPPRWTELAPLPTARGGLVSVAADGQIFAIGGATSDFAQTLSTVEAYDPVMRTWSAVTSAGLTARVDLGAASADGRIYAIGGYDSNGNASAAVESFDPRDPAAGWRSEAPLPIVSPSGWAGSGGIAAAGGHGLIYAVGGYDQDGNVLANLEIYDPRTNTWRAGPPMPTARGLLRATFADGRLYAIGGLDSTGTIPFDTVESYDPTTERWTSDAPIPIPRAEPALATLTDGQIIAAGGCCVPGTIDSGVPVDLSDTELYSPWSNTWHQLAPLPEARASLSGAPFGDDGFLAIGGFQASPSGPQAESYVDALQVNPW
jgi:N-acetylneuraminic acid mutarotase